MKYRAVIFDFDGTLGDTLGWMRGALNAGAEKYGYRAISRDEALAWRDLSGTELLRAMNIPLWKLPRVVQEMREAMSAERDRLKLFPGVDGMLQRLAAGGVLLAVVSSNSPQNVRHILGEGNAALIDRFNCGASLFGKARKLRATVRALGVAPAETVYIGDEIRDGEAAQQAGIAFGAVAWGQHSEAALQAQKPTEVFKRVSQIAEKFCASS